MRQVGVRSRGVLVFLPDAPGAPGGERRAGDVALPLPAEPLLQESEEEIVDADFIRRWLRMLLRSPMEPWAVRMCMDLGASRKCVRGDANAGSRSQLRRPRALTCELS